MAITKISKNEFLEKVPPECSGLIELVKSMKARKKFIKYSDILYSATVSDVEIAISVDLRDESVSFAEEIVLRELCEDIYCQKVDKEDWNKKEKTLIDSINSEGYSVNDVNAGYGDSKYYVFTTKLENFNQDNFKNVVDLLEIYNRRARKMFAE